MCVCVCVCGGGGGGGGEEVSVICAHLAKKQTERVLNSIKLLMNTQVCCLERRLLKTKI